jgi:hypothetical protein
MGEDLNLMESTGTWIDIDDMGIEMNDICIMYSDVCVPHATPPPVLRRSSGLPSPDSCYDRRHTTNPPSRWSVSPRQSFPAYLPLAHIQTSEFIMKRRNIQDIPLLQQPPHQPSITPSIPFPLKPRTDPSQPPYPYYQAQLFVR